MLPSTSVHLLEIDDDDGGVVVVGVGVGGGTDAVADVPFCVVGEVVVGPLLLSPLMLANVALVPVRVLVPFVALGTVPSLSPNCAASSFSPSSSSSVTDGGQ